MKWLVKTLVTDLTISALVLVPWAIIVNPAMHMRPAPPWSEFWRIFWAAYGL